MASQYERFTLLMDDESGPLGPIALQLLELGIDTLYASDVNEGELLARQEATRLGAVVVPSSMDPVKIGRVMSQICPRMVAGTQALVMTGAKPDGPVCEDLRAKGAKWCLWNPYEIRDLRFVMTAAMSIGDRSDPRSDLRIPTALKAQIEHGDAKQSLNVHNLSASGAFLETEEPLKPGAELDLAMSFDAGGFEAKAMVVNVKQTDGSQRGDVPAGMGIRFSELDFGAERVIRGHIADWLSQFWL